MNETSKPLLTADKVLWFLHQLRGLPDAVKHFHRQRRQPRWKLSLLWSTENRYKFVALFHNGIKPENILVIGKVAGDEPAFKFRDFSAATFAHFIPEVSTRVFQDQWIHNLAMVQKFKNPRLPDFLTCGPLAVYFWSF